MRGSRFRAVNVLGAGWEGLEARTLLSGGRVGTVAAELGSLPAAAAVGRPPSLFVEPNAGRQPILQFIQSARTEIRIGICNLSDPVVGDALIAAAARGVNVRVIVDRADYLAKPPEQQEVASLLAGGVQVHLSNPVFPQSFPKYILVDRSRVMIMTLCIVPQTFEDTRDYGVVLVQPQVIHGVASIFEVDWTHSAPPGVVPPAYNPTPAVHAPSLVVSPANASAQLSRLITGARRTIDVTTEVVNDLFLEGQLIAAAKRGVRVRLIAPVVSRENNDNAAALQFLAQNGVQVHVTTSQSPPVGAMPYMHAKTIVVDGRVTYLGSIDLDTTQTSQDRELGIILRGPSIARAIGGQFALDWWNTRPL